MAWNNSSACRSFLKEIRQQGYFLPKRAGKDNSSNHVINNKSNLHVSSKTNYVQAATLPIPPNVDPAETTRFSHQRSRDISATAILTHPSSKSMIFDITFDGSAASSANNEFQTFESSKGSNSNAIRDPHLESYDCFNAINLNSAMQSNVPSPLGGLHKYTHLNMPGGQYSQEPKFVSHDLHNSHYMTLRQKTRGNDWTTNTELMMQDNNANENIKGKGTLFLANALMCKKGNSSFVNNHQKRSYHYCNLHSAASNFTNKNVSILMNANKIHFLTNECLLMFNGRNSINKQSRMYSNSNKDSAAVGTENVKAKLTRREQLKRAVKDYGSTVIVFHIVISLISLEIFYLLVSSGIDLSVIVNFMGLEESSVSKKIAEGASTFVVAYAIHKIFAPVRIGITLGSAPIIVRYLRAKGILKTK